MHGLHYATYGLSAYEFLPNKRLLVNEVSNDMHEELIFLTTIYSRLKSSLPAETPSIITKKSNPRKSPTYSHTLVYFDRKETKHFEQITTSTLLQAP